MSSEPRLSPIHSDTNNNGVYKRERPSRACTARSAARIYEAAVAEAAVAEAAVVVAARKHKLKSRRRRKEVVEEEEEEEEEQPPSPPNPYSDVVTKLVGEPPPSQLPRWDIRSMWELASILNFLNVFRPQLNIKVEFSVEELETALITPNNTLGEIHIPLLKAIPPVTRMALGQNTWITVLCRKLKDWWHWVSEGELPIVASHGAEIDTYNTLDPGVRVVILKALCDIRVEQDDIRSYIDDSIKHGVPLSAFRKERTGGDSHGVSFWYEDDPIIGQRLYREIRKTEVKKGKGKNVHSISSCQWETVSTNLDEFQDVSEKLLSSKNRTETSLGKKLKNDMLPEIEKVQKRKEKLLKKQHREALLLDGMILDGLGPGRSLRGRKQVSYTFDDYDRSISEAIKITKMKHPSPEPSVRREGLRHGNSTNGRWGGGTGTGPAPSPNPHNTSFTPASPDSLNEYETDNEDEKSEQLDRSDRTRQRPQRYSAREFVEAVSDNEAGMDSDYKVDDDDDDDIVGEAVYDEEYLKKRKERKKMSSSSEGDEEYRWDGDKSEEEEEDEGEESLSASEDSEESPRRSKKLSGRTRRGTKIRSVREVKSRPRRSRRATRTRIDYNQYEFSDSEPESAKPETSNSEKSGFSMGTSDDDTEAENNDENNFDNENEVDKENEIDNENDIDNEDEDDDNENEENVIDEPDEPVTEEHQKVKEQEQNETPMKLDSPVEDDEFENGARKRRFLDLNELAPGSGFEDGPMKDDDNDNL